MANWLAFMHALMHGRTEMASDTHAVTLWPKIHKQRAWATCSTCHGYIERGHYERHSNWRKRLANWMNKHAPFHVVDLTGADMEA